jgi:hypothetical protein
MTTTCVREESSPAKSWLLDSWTISVVVARIETRKDRIARVDVKRRRARAVLRLLTYSLRRGLLRSSGLIDGPQRTELGADVWVDFHIVGGPLGDIEVRSRRSYPASQVHNQVSPTVETIWAKVAERINAENSLGPGSGFRGYAGPRYHKTIEGFLVSIEDVKRVWPPRKILEPAVAAASIAAEVNSLAPTSSSSHLHLAQPNGQLSEKKTAIVKEHYDWAFPSGITSAMSTTERNRRMQKTPGAKSFGSYQKDYNSFFEDHPELYPEKYHTRTRRPS